MPPPVHADIRGPGAQDQAETQSPAGHQSQGCLQGIHPGNATLLDSNTQKCYTTLCWYHACRDSKDVSRDVTSRPNNVWNEAILFHMNHRPNDDNLAIKLDSTLRWTTGTQLPSQHKRYSFWWSYENISSEYKKVSAQLTIPRNLSPTCWILFAQGGFKISKSYK